MDGFGECIDDERRLLRLDEPADDDDVASEATLEIVDGESAWIERVRRGATS